MHVGHEKRIVALPILVTLLLLSGCGSTSGIDVAKDVGTSMFVEVASIVVADCKDDPQPRNHSICEEQQDAVKKFGQSVHRELTPVDTSPDAEELSRDLEAFIEQRRGPVAGYGDDAKETSSL